MEKFQDECGVVAAYMPNSTEAAKRVYLGLNGIQHRGQESCGIAVERDGQISCYKNNGLVTDVFTPDILELLGGGMCIGHVNSGLVKSSFTTNAQPFVINNSKGSIAVAYNGGLVNSQSLRQELESNGAVFTSDSDSETIAYIIAQHNKGDILEAIAKTLDKLKGGYAFCVLTRDIIVGVRDPFGIRPLCIGKSKDGYFFASENCAIDIMGAKMIRDMKPGEIGVLNGDSFFEYNVKSAGETARCIFEYVYFARPDSKIDGVNVFAARELSGRILAREKPVDADIVLGVPDSGTPAALGFSAESRIPYSATLIKNKYIGRTYIILNEAERNLSVKIKLNPIKDYICGKRVVIVDDSIVRGTTMKSLIESIRELGALEVHLRISSPAIIHKCYFGVQTPDEKELVANQLTKQGLANLLGADTLEYISVNGLAQATGNSKDCFCLGCFTGKYPEV